MNAGRQFDILGFGTLAVDDIVYVERYPPADQKARITGSRRNLGGQVATALAAAVRLGIRSAFAGLLGDDELSNAAWQSLAAAGVDCRFVQCASGARPIHSIIIVDESSRTRNIFFSMNGVRQVPERSVTESMIAAARILLVDQLGPESILRAAQLARGLGIPVVMDMEWADAPLIGEMMSLADHLIVPGDFASAVTGAEAPEQITAELHRRSPRACTAVTCGSGGCYYLTALDPTVRHMPAPTVETVETNGCGDVFHGAYAASLANGGEPLECLRFATAAAAAFASRPGGWHNLPDAGDVAQILERMDREEPV